MARRGAKTKYRADFHPEDFIKQSRQGKTLAQIAASWNIDRDSITNWGNKNEEFFRAIKEGRQLAEAWYINIGQMAVLGKVTVEGKPVQINLGFFVWMTKNMFNWSDKVEQKLDAKVEDTTVFKTQWQTKLEEPKS